jgi:two-component system OmpR family response regulator
VIDVRLLVAEDDRRLAGLLRRGLEGEGYAVDLAGTAEETRWLATEVPYDTIVLDVMLPDGDGFELCRELRAAGRWAPVLFLTARSAVADRVRGLDDGGDDYLVKPFEWDELLARIRALVRRGARPRPSVLDYGSFVLDPASREVRVDGRPVDLSPREFAILELLARHPNEAVSRAEIRERVWDWAFEGRSNVVDVHVGAIRRKLTGRPGAPTIEPVRGVGYVFRPPSGAGGGAARIDDPDRAPDAAPNPARTSTPRDLDR